MCGDGTVEGNEACDDGNLNSSDGCSSACIVESGWTCNGMPKSQCTDINECLTNPCDPHATCTNTNGSFTCMCNSGYTGNGMTCSPICDLPPILANKQINYDLKTATVSGNITLNGGIMPDDTNPQYSASGRGSLIFRRKDNNSTVYVNIGETGAATYTTSLFAGVYDIDFSAFYAYGQSVLPDGITVPVATGVTIQANTILNYDLKTATVTSNITLNGGTMPDDMNPQYSASGRGSLILRRKDNNSTTYLNIGETGPAMVQTTVFTGAYDVDFSAFYAYGQSVLPDGITTPVATGVMIQANAALNYDLKTATVTSNITLNGGTMPDDMNPQYSASGRGSLILRRKDNNSTTYLNIGETGPAMVQASVFVGAYDVDFSAFYAYGQSVLPDGLTTPVATGVMIQANSAFNYDLKTATVTSNITLNGGSMPDDMNPQYSASGRGSLILRRKDNNSTTYLNIGETGPALVQASIFVGAYDVDFSAFYAYGQSVLPDGLTTPVATGVMIQANSAFNYNLKTATVTSNITLNGGSMPDDMNPQYSASGRGSLILRRKDNNSTMYLNIGETGPAMVQAPVFVGAYDVDFSAFYAYGQSVLPDGITTPVATGVMVQANSALNYDLKTATVMSTITLNGGIMPDDMNTQYSASGRGSLILRRKDNNSMIYLNIGELGPAMVQASIFVGAYNVDFSAFYTYGQSVLPDGITTPLAIGCP